MLHQDSFHFTDSDALLFKNFLLKDLNALNEFPRKHHKWLIKQVKRFYPDLWENGLVEDVVQEMWILLLEKGLVEFDSTRGNAFTYLFLLLRRAARKIHSVYVQPSQKTRPSKSEIKLDEYSYSSPLSIEEMEFLGISIPSKAQWGEVDTKIDTQLVLDAAETEGQIDISRSLELYSLGYNWTEVSKLVGVERSTLRRKIQRWTSDSANRD